VKPMLARSHRRVLFLLAVVSVVGLLSMHGFDPVVTAVDRAPAGHSTDSQAGPEGHAVIGLCVFVGAFATLGLALLGGSRHSTSDTPRFLQLRSSVRTGPASTSRPPLLHRLCVLRV